MEAAAPAATSVHVTHPNCEEACHAETCSATAEASASTTAEAKDEGGREATEITEAAALNWESSAYAPAAPANDLSCALQHSIAGSVNNSLGATWTRHEWCDDLIRRLSNYHRPPDLTQSPAECAPSIDNGGPCADLQAAATKLLQVMQRAVDIRAHCIEGPAQHAVPTSRYRACSAVAAHLPSESGQLAVDSDGSGHSTLQQLAAAEQPCHVGDSAAVQEAPTSATTTMSCTSDMLASGIPPAPVMIMFSGGVDSMLVAALTHRSLPFGVPIDLANVCFDRGKSPDRLAAMAALNELAEFAPERCWRLIRVRGNASALTFSIAQSAVKSETQIPS